MAGLLALATPAAARDAAADCRSVLGKVDLPQESILASPAAYPIPAGAIESPAAFVAAVAQAEGRPVIVTGADLSGWDMRASGRALPKLCFIDSNLSHSRWDGLDLSGSAFVRSDLSEARFDEAVLAQVLLRDSRLAGTVMRLADLSGGTLDGGWFADLSAVSRGEGITASLDGWVLDQADLTDFRFDCGIGVDDGCPLERAIRLTGARLTGADLSAFPGSGALAVAQARLDRTVIAPDQLRFFAEARLDGPVVIAGGDRRLALTPEETRALIAGYRRAAAQDSTPAFSCAAAAAPVETLICSKEGLEAGLPERDRQLAAAYAAARSTRPAALAEQRAWLRARNRCTTAECLADSYEKRLAALLGQVGTPASLEPGKPVLFVESSLVPDLEASQAALLARIAPVLIAAADQWIVVSHRADGTLDAVGQAIGANAHLCSLDARGLRLDRKTGWFARVGASGTATPAIRLIGERIEVLENGRPDLEAWPEADFVSCGMRASFAEGVRIEADPAVIADLASRWAE